MKRYSLEESFSLAANRLMKQGSKAYQIGTNGEGNSCRYRAADGSKCFVGHLIADEHYNPDIEGENAEDQRVIEALCASGHGNIVPGDILVVCQNIHDEVDPEKWEEEYTRLAYEEGIVWDRSFEG